jgi:hypothetical protein
MRAPLGLLLGSSLLVACGGGDGDDGNPGDPDAGDQLPADSFRIVTSDISIAPGEERTDCFYTSVPVDRAVGVKRFSSTMTQGSHHMIVYALGTSSQPDGTIVRDCEVFGGASFSLPAWTYSAQNPVAETTMPDGVGIGLDAGQKIVIEMHYFNASPDPLTAHVELVGEYYAEGVEYQRAAAYVTYDTSIVIPAGVGETATAGGECDVPAGARFLSMSTHAHKRATLTRVSDGGEMIFESNDWEHPGAVKWDAEPFYQFSGKLQYYCEYENDRETQVTEGSSADANEMCMASGFFFPADRARFCINNTLY